MMHHMALHMEEHMASHMENENENEDENENDIESEKISRNFFTEIRVIRVSGKERNSPHLSKKCQMASILFWEGRTICLTKKNG